MAINKFVYEVLETQRQKVLDIQSNEITILAKDIAFYSAMIDAAIDDPLTPEADQDEMLAFLKDELNKLVNVYQIKVNSWL